MSTTYTPEQIREVLAQHDAAYRKTSFSGDEQVFRELCNVRQRAQTMREIIEQLQAENARLRAGLNAVQTLIDESHGVAGLHKNGDVAPWGELMEDGRYPWLSEFSRGLNA